ncbi:MAG: hypothetical protein RL235_178 [Chlamydiota bacterium]
MNEPWFQEGLRFQCTGCGGCCTGSPGYVFLSEPDLDALTRHLQCDRDAFIRTYARQVDTQLALIEDPVNYDCVFLKDKRCSVYEARPVQCRTFPWWIQHLREPTDWQAAKERCEGIDHPDAPVVASDTIAEQCLIYLDNLVAQHFIYEQ